MPRHGGARRRRAELRTRRTSNALPHLWQTARPPLSHNNGLCLVASLSRSLAHSLPPFTHTWRDKAAASNERAPLGLALRL